MLITELDGPVTILTLSRPKKMNALNFELVEAINQAIDDASLNGTRLLVFRGAGKGFSGGFDFSDIDSESDADLVLRFIRLEQLLQKIYHAPFSTMALAHGACFGAAADIFCCCDHRVVESDAKFRMPGLQFGIVLGTRRLTHVVGSDKARALLEASPVFRPADVADFGFVTEISAQENWPHLVTNSARSAVVLPIEVSRHMRSILRADTRDEDLAALVRSASVPGLKQRIKEFRTPISPIKTG